MTADDEIVREVCAEAVLVPEEEKEDENSDAEVHNNSEKKKKKKRKPKKKKMSSSTVPVTYEESDLKPQVMRQLGGYSNYYIKYGQTPIPSIEVI